MSHLVLTASDHPLVSVIVVTFGGGEWLDRALRALEEHTPLPHEVIVVDNASPDGTGAWLGEHLSGATLILHRRNVGFGPAANVGAAHATGAFLCFLNPDAVVEHGWLEPLVAAVERPGVGAATACLLNVDGSLQEAGSLVGGDAVTWAIGRDEDPSDPEYRFPLDVHFGSAACLVLRRGTFARVGGFDPAYRPAYCEDVDLALSLRRVGLRTVYEPESRVRHVRAASSDLRRAQRMIEANRRILRERWGDELAERPPLDRAWDYPHRPIAARDFDVLDRILVVADRVPSLHPEDPDADVASLVLELRQRWPAARVTLVAEEGDPAEFAERGVEVAVGPRDWGAWFERRRYQATAVVVAGAAPRFAPFLEDTQPAAPRWRMREEPRPSLEAALAELGVAPPPLVPVEGR